MVRCPGLSVQDLVVLDPAFIVAGMPLGTLPNSFARFWVHCGIQVNFAGIDRREGGHERLVTGKNWWALNVLMQGRIRITTAVLDLSVVGPAAYLVPPQTPYREIVDRCPIELFGSGFFLILRNLGIHPLDGLPLPKVVVIADLALWRNYCHEAASCFRNFSSIDFGHNVQARLPIDRLLHLYLTSLPWDRIESRGLDQAIPRWVAELRGRIKRNLRNAVLDFPAIVRWSGFTASHVNHAFKRYYSVSPMRLVRDERLMLAARQLENNPTESVATLASSVGYTDASLFTRHFTAKFGIPPRAYRTGRPDVAKAGPMGATDVQVNPTR